ncbi:hypothetical protein AE00_02333 [Klebsiella pneumoniae MGH 74]|nr:hypothetical protein AE00_02333 [Klebsiella pneumoniae MGH 74]SAX41548.1 Uncharacterised protein [Klebsiella quasipneumoniae]SBW92615.1 Uncharacterised protein [Klebsiella quasipneumoniae]SBY74712.1 Uncharacterised protein [Klebsiella quasipneumoniae]
MIHFFKKIEEAFLSHVLLNVVKDIIYPLTMKNT